MEKASMATTVLAAGITIESTSSTMSIPKPMATEDDVRILEKGDYKGAALCLAEAFVADDVARYFIDTPDRSHWSDADKWQLHLSIMEYVVFAHCLKGLVTTTGPNYDCVALWMPPGKNMDDWCTILRSGLWRLNYKLSAEGKQRFFHEFLPLLHDTKHDVLGARDHDSWYLVYVGTKASARGKGYARKLIEHVTRQADLTNRACYLESSNGINPLIYAKLGFAIKRKIHLVRGDRPVELDIMVREPLCAGKSERRVGMGVNETKMATVRKSVGDVSTGTTTAETVKRG